MFTPASRRSRPRFHRRTGVLLVLLSAATLRAQAPDPPAPRDLMLKRMGQIVSEFEGDVCLAVRNLKTGETIEERSDERVRTASVIKFPIMVEVFYQAHEGKLRLGEVLEVAADNQVVGSGVLKDLHLGLKLTLRDAVVLMIVLSDNSATNLVIDRVGIDKVNDRMRKLGLVQTQLFKKVFKPATGVQTEETKKFGLGVTTAREMMTLMEKLARRELVSREASEEMLSILRKQHDQDEVPRYLYPGETRRAELKIANKTGALDDLRNDVALVETPRGDYVFSVFCQNARDRRWIPENAASVTIARLARLLFDYFWDAAKPVANPK